MMGELIMWIQVGFCYMLLMLVTVGASAQPSSHGRWELAVEEDFEDPGSLDDGWHMDGAGEASITEAGQLQIATTRQSVNGTPTQAAVFWHKTPVWGDVRIEVTCRAEPDSRVLLFFNARATDEAEDLFAWKRPRADYADYAYEPRLELHSIGLLRPDQTRLNLRYLGRDIPEAWMNIMPYHPERFPARYLEEQELQAALAALDLDALPDLPAERQALAEREPFAELLAPHVKRWQQVNAAFQEASILANHEADQPVFADPDKWYQVTVQSVGERITVHVDDQLIIDHIDTDRTQRPLRGGHLGFRNFRPTTVWYDNLRIYRRLYDGETE